VKPIGKAINKCDSGIFNKERGQNTQKTQKKIIKPLIAKTPQYAAANLNPRRSDPTGTAPKEP
jgi:hypothetical protein